MTTKDSDTEAGPEKKAKTFCCRTFRQEIKGSDTLKSLKKFVSAAKSSDDVVFEYLECGGSLSEILSLMDATARGDLTTALPVFEAAHLILLKFQSADSEYHQHCLEGARNILQIHILTIQAMLSMNIAKQKKVALKLLTAIATLSMNFATEVLNIIVLNPTMITDFIKHTSDKESVRKCFILFVLSFLIDGNTSNIKNILEKKGFLSSIIPGLKFDDATTVNLTLSVLEDKILKNVKIHKTLKLKLFNTQNIKYLFDLYDWKGPQSTKELIPKKKNHKIKEILVNPKEKELVVDSAHSFLLLLCCSKKHGVAFADKSMGTSDQLNNQLLLTVFESLADPLKNKKVAEVIMKTVAVCPDLMKPVLLKLEPLFQPRDSKNWYDAVDFAEELIKTVDPLSMLKNEAEEVTSTFVGKVAKSLCAPFVLLRISKNGAQKTQPIEVQLCSLKLLTTIWTEIEKLTSNYPKFENDLRTSLIAYVTKHLPEGGDLVELWHNLCDDEYISGSTMVVKKRSLFLSVVLSALQVLVECQKEEVSSLSLASDMLKHVDVIKESLKDEEFYQIRVKIVQFVEIDLSSLTPDKDLFEKSLLILLKSSDDDSICRGSRILANISIFKKNKSEVDVWLMCLLELPSELRIIVLGYLIESLRRFFNKESSALEDIEMDAILEGAMEIDQPTEENSLTPLLFECLETLESKSAEKKNSNVATFKQYLSDVVLHLQIFYTTDLFLYDTLKPHKKMLNKSVMECLKSWGNRTSTNLDVFTCPHERDLVRWLSTEDPQKFQDLVSEKQNLLKMYSLFRIVLAYLAQKSISEDLKFDEIPKYVEALQFFMKLGPAEEVEADVVSCNLSTGGLSRKCLDCIFENKCLLNCFNIFNKKQEGSYHSTLVVVRALMEGSIAAVKQSLIEPWKCQLLKQIKAKLKKNKMIEDVEGLTTVLDFFEYEHADAKELVQLLISSDMSLFTHKKKLSSWINILVKFVKLHCVQEPINDDVVNKLCLIMKQFSSQHDLNVQVLDDCFVFLLKTHPRHLTMIENDFLDVILQRTNTTSSTEILIKLLLNDPKKAKHFVQNAAKNLEKLENPQVFLSSLSVLLIQEDAFLESIKSRNGCLVWKSSELQQKNCKQFLDVLELIYKKFELQIIQSIKGETEDFVLENLNVCCQLVQLFIDKKTISKYKKEMCKGMFQPQLLFEAVKKLNSEEITVSYLLGLLVLFSKIIKKSKDSKEELWSEYCSLIAELIKLNKEGSWENVAESSEWKDFTKLALGHCFSSSKNPFLLRILRLLISTIHKSEDKALGLFFQMLISHSQFLNIILSKSELKNELVELFHSLTEKNCFEKSPKHIPILLAAYNASMSPSDVALLNILRLYEKNGVSVSDYEPFVWGETAVSHYSVGGNPGLSLWQRFSMANVLDLLDARRMEISLKEFPIHRSLELNQHLECDGSIYDPAFLLPLFVNLLSPGSVVFCLPFIYKGGLAYTVRALSSECTDVRIIASVVLNRFYNHLEMSQNLKQKLVWMHFINCFRYAIEDLSIHSVPGITSLFFARMTLELSKQPAEMFKPLQNFLLAKPYIGFDTIPEFLPFFHSSEVSHWKLRQWLLEVLRDGTKTTADLNIIYHSMALKVIFCFYHSQLCDNDTRKLILQVMAKLIPVDKSLLLISEYGIINWISSISSGSFHFIMTELLQLLSVIASAIIKDVTLQKSKYTNSTHIVQILNFAVRLLPVFSSAKSVELFRVYIRIMLDCFGLFISEGRDWFRFNKSKIEEIVETGIRVLGLDCGKYAQVSFFFRDFEKNSEVSEELKKVVYVFSLLANESVS